MHRPGCYQPKRKLLRGFRTHKEDAPFHGAPVIQAYRGKGDQWSAGRSAVRAGERVCDCGTDTATDTRRGGNGEYLHAFEHGAPEPGEFADNKGIAFAKFVQDGCNAATASSAGIISTCPVSLRMPEPRRSETGFSG